MRKTLRLGVASLMAASALAVTAPAQAGTAPCYLITDPIIVPGTLSVIGTWGVSTYPQPVTGTCLGASVGVLNVAGTSHYVGTGIGDGAYSNEVTAGGYAVCTGGFGWCVLYGASIQTTGTSRIDHFVGVCYIDSVQAICVPGPIYDSGGQ